MLEWDLIELNDHSIKWDLSGVLRVSGGYHYHEEGLPLP
jgi:hypothetical protein